MRAANPKNPTSWNMYAYVHDDPINFTDPTGLDEYEGSPPAMQCTIDGQELEGGACELYWDSTGADVSYKKHNPSVTPAQRKDALQKARSYLAAAEMLAENAITNPDCYGLFGSRADGLTAQQVLAAMESGTAYGKIEFIYNPNDSGVATTRPTISLNNVVGVTSTVTKINAAFDSSGYWNYGDAVENADTLLHELGHVLRDLGFKGGDFQQDDSSTDVNQHNSIEIREQCLK